MDPTNADPMAVVWGFSWIPSSGGGGGGDGEAVDAEEGVGKIHIDQKVVPTQNISTQLRLGFAHDEGVPHLLRSIQQVCVELQHSEQGFLERGSGHQGDHGFDLRNKILDGFVSLNHQLVGELEMREEAIEALPLFLCEVGSLELQSGDVLCKDVLLFANECEEAGPEELSSMVQFRRGQDLAEKKKRGRRQG